MPKYLVPLCIEDWGLEGTLEINAKNELEAENLIVGFVKKLEMDRRVTFVPKQKVSWSV